MEDYYQITQRIQRIYDTCNDKEKYFLGEILHEISLFGYSDTYRDIWLSDYKEIPVDIHTFLCDDRYLGKTNRNGEGVYPFWHKTLEDIFSAGNKYEEIFFTGATRIGKSTTAVTGTSYMLYKLMCLRDPQLYFGKKDISKFSILFFNITKDLARGVAFREFNDTLKVSPWFNEHGTFSLSDRNFYYIPEGGKVVIDYGSDAAHALGQQVFVGFCVVGSTPVLTSEGYVNIEDISGKTAEIAQFNDGQIVYSDAYVGCTGYVDTTIRVELEDGTIFEGTPDHLVMLSDGSYKKLSELSNSDDILTFNINEADYMNLKDRNKKFVVYKHTSPQGKVYIGITCDIPYRRWGKDGSGYIGNNHFYSAIQKYGWDSFKHEIVYSDLTIDEASEKEIELIAKYRSSDPEFGYNQTLGGEVGFPSDETRRKLSKSTSSLWKTPEFRNKVCASLTGHTISEESRRKIGESQRRRFQDPDYVFPLKGVPKTQEVKDKLSNSMKGRTSWCKGFTKETHPSVMKISLSKKGVSRTPESIVHQKMSLRKRYDEYGYSPIWITDGYVEKQIDSSTQSIPYGFHRGRLDLDYTYIHDPGTGEERKIPKSELDYFLSSGWMLGPGDTRLNNIRKSNQKFNWIYDEHSFESAEKLADYLRKNGYPRIVSSTITALYNKGFETSKTYSSLAGKIVREDVSR